MTFLGVEITRAAFIAEVLAVSFALLAAGFTALAFHLKNRVDTARAVARAQFESESKAAIAHAESRAAEANEKAAAATERTARLEVEAATQRERAAKAELSLTEVMRRTTDRTLTPAQRTRIVSALKSAPRGRVDVLSPGDGEARRFADQIADALKAAGLDVHSSIAVAGMSGFGLHVQQRSRGDAQPLTAVVYKALNDAGLKPEPSFDATMREGDVKVVVAHKR